MGEGLQRILVRRTAEQKKGINMNLRLELSFYAHVLLASQIPSPAIVNLHPSECRKRDLLNR